MRSLGDTELVEWIGQKLAADGIDEEIVDYGWEHRGDQKVFVVAFAEKFEEAA